MNYLVYISRLKFDIGMTNWLIANVSGQGLNWKVIIDIYERRAIYFKNEKDYKAFKLKFGL